MRRKQNKKKNGNTANALLGILSMGPRSGYDIRQLISESIGYFWSESYGQIYPGLKRLTEKGLVAKKTERRKGAPDRNVYSLTADGRRELRNWLKLPAAKEVPRNELLLKLFFGAHVPVEVSRKHVQTYLGQQQAALKKFDEIDKKLRKEEAKDPQLPYWLMTLSMGRHHSKAMVEWCRERLGELDRLEKRRGGSDART